VVMHNRVKEALGSVLPIDKAMSIDEMACRLHGENQKPEAASALGRKIKGAIYDLAGDHMRGSIGVAPNTMLAKVAADLRKPDGLTVLTDDTLAETLAGLRLEDFPGIGPRMARRLNLYGVASVRQLCGLPLKTLCEVWKSRVLGGRWHALLRGDEVDDPPTRRQTVSHSHILPPDLRSDSGSYGVVIRLTHKAAARLRKIGYWAGRVSVGVSFLDADRGQTPGWNRNGWDAACRLPHCQDTPAILQAVAKVWKARPPNRVPLKVGVVLSDLKHQRCATPSLFEEDRKAAEVSRAMDLVNAEFGASVVHFGAMHGYEDAAPTRIAWTQIPDFDRRVS
jgi:DNA polymerase-4